MFYVLKKRLEYCNEINEFLLHKHTKYTFVNNLLKNG